MSLIAHPHIKPKFVRPRILSFHCVLIRDVEAEAGSGSGPFSVEAEARKIHRFRLGRKNKEKRNLVLLSFVEEQIEGAYTLRNESEEESFREMLTST